MPKRGEIWLAHLDPQYGTEPGKTRPVLFVQAQALLDAGHPSTLVIPLTTRLVDDAEPLRVRVRASGRLPGDSDLLVDQLRAIDNRRLGPGPVTRLSESLLEKVEAAMREVLGMELPLPRY
ncbi:MAG: type II toxin-antitoxin system PemK/MazF family toxin [Acidobacteria bacterium]|nr:type II toxin-antitoxin system PemK/MazF family toxin [Acidobacteriota bacterium]